MEFSTKDALRISAARTERLLEELPYLQDAVLMFVNTENSIELRIACTDPQQVDDVLLDEMALLEDAWLIGGAFIVSVWFAGEELWRGDYRRYQEQVLESVVAELVNNMPATLEKPASTRTARIPRTTKKADNLSEMPAQKTVTVGAIASRLNLPEQSIIDWLEAHQIQPLSFRGDIAADTATKVIDHFWDQSKGAVLSDLGLVAGGNYGMPSGDPMKPAKTARKPRATGTKKTTKTSTRGRKPKTAT